LLLAGAGVAASLLLPKLPHEHQVGLRLPDPASVTAVDVAWTSPTDGDPVQGGSWRFASGSAPAMVQTRPRLPDGRYGLDVIIERGPSRESFRKAITLSEADHIVVPLQ
jgi:hypothetical protein